MGQPDSGHARRICSLDLPPIQSLDIPDEYEFMDPELVELIRTAVEAIITDI
jgi:predicted protein tyrosine phosphatase